MTVFLIVHSINYYEKIKKYKEENIYYYLENTVVCIRDQTRIVA